MQMHTEDDAPAAYHQEIHEFLESSFNDVPTLLSSLPTVFKPRQSPSSKMSTAKIEGIEIRIGLRRGVAGVESTVHLKCIRGTSMFRLP